MSCSVDNYREFLDGQGTLNLVYVYVQRINRHTGWY